MLPSDTKKLIKLVILVLTGSVVAVDCANMEPNLGGFTAAFLGHFSRRKIMRVVAMFVLAMAFCSNAAADDLTAGDYAAIRSALARGVGSSICSLSGGGMPAGAICGELGVQAAYWLNEGVSIVVDRYFEAKDRQFAKEHGLTICYSDGKCIAPK